MFLDSEISRNAKKNPEDDTAKVQYFEIGFEVAGLNPYDVKRYAMGKEHTSFTKVSKQVLPKKRDDGISIGDDPNDIWNKTRNACMAAILKALKTCIDKNENTKFMNSASEIAKTYETELYKKYRGSLNEYKLRFRKDLTAIRNLKTMFALNLLSGELSVLEFVSLDEKDLISFKQKEQNSKLLGAELKNSLGKQFPTSINEIKNQNTVVAEKWGISESAAKIDPEFDIN